MEEYTTPKLHMDILRILLRITTDLFDKYNIKYFIDGGTLLGAVRHNDIIPHDDDIDLGIFDNDWHKLSKLEELTKITFIFNEHSQDSCRLQTSEQEYRVSLQRGDDCLIKVFVPNLWVKCKQTGRITGTPTLDIFKWRRAGDSIKLASQDHRSRFPNCYYKKEEMYPLVKYKIGEVEAYGSNNPFGYLCRYYGEDALTVVKIDKREENNMLDKSRNAISISL